MAILSLGVSHRRATVDLLERLAFTDDDRVKAYRRAADDHALDGCVVLSTCNRVEIYAQVDTYHAGFLALKRLLCETRGIAAEDLAEPLYSNYEEAAAEHLFTVASGLDSMVLGEQQILSQVREAHHRAEAEGATRPALTALFHAAARVGRRVRSETTVGAAPDAFVAAGTELAEGWLGDLDGKRAVVVGAGQMSALAIKHLHARGVGRLRVLNRSLERARALAARTGAEHGDLKDLATALTGADLVVTATGAAGTVVEVHTVERAMAVRPDRRLFLLDLAVPRDVAASSGDVPGVRLVDIEGLRDALDRRREAGSAGQADIELAHRIVQEELRRFAIRRRSEHLGPLIQALRERGDEIMRAELERFRADLAELTPDERAAVEALARGIVGKLLHEPVIRLKERAAPGTEGAHARLVADLFDLDRNAP